MIPCSLVLCTLQFAHTAAVYGFFTTLFRVVCTSANNFSFDSFFQLFVALFFYFRIVCIQIAKEMIGLETVKRGSDDFFFHFWSFFFIIKVNRSCT